MKWLCVSSVFVFSFAWFSNCCGQIAEPVETSAPKIHVTTEHLLRAADHAENWLTYSGSYSAKRYSRLDQIDATTVADVKLKWVKQFPIAEPFECSPLVVDGVMYVTLPENQVKALDARTGLVFWEYQHKLPAKLAVCCGKINRGVADPRRHALHGDIRRETGCH